MTWFLIAVRQEVKRIDNLVVVHEVELAINATYRAVYEVEVTSISKPASSQSLSGYHVSSIQSLRAWVSVSCFKHISMCMLDN